MSARNWFSRLKIGAWNVWQAVVDQLAKESKKKLGTGLVELKQMRR